jgi:hypothetical protein
MKKASILLAVVLFCTGITFAGIRQTAPTPAKTVKKDDKKTDKRTDKKEVKKVPARKTVTKSKTTTTPAK